MGGSGGGEDGGDMGGTGGDGGDGGAEGGWHIPHDRMQYSITEQGKQF
jgi:hypothetical protein